MNIPLSIHKTFFTGAFAVVCALALAGCQGQPDALAAGVSGAVNAASPLGVASVTPRAAPASVVGLSGRSVVVDTGAVTLQVGTLYQAVRVGAAGDVAPGTPCCSIRVDRVSANQAYGHIVDADFHADGKFVPGSIELRAPVPLQSVVAVTARMVATN